MVGSNDLRAVVGTRESQGWLERPASGGRHDGEPWLAPTTGGGGRHDGEPWLAPSTSERSVVGTTESHGWLIDLRAVVGTTESHGWLHRPASGGWHDGGWL